MLQLKIIIASTRPTRKGPIVAAWIHDLARNFEGFETELLDLAEINLPMFNEPEHPRLRKYQHQHTKEWSAKIEPADAFLVVTPEYNYGFPATIKNALDYLVQEWAYKPIAFVSYGGVAAGTRSVQMLKLVVTALKLMPVPEGVNIPNFTQFIDDKGVLNANEQMQKGATGMLNELHKWAAAMKPMRNTTPTT
jgi:NAD(P)H-dependent FMN reductase